MHKTYRKLLTTALIILIVATFLIGVRYVLAVEVGIEPVEDEIELGGGDIRVMIARIINVALGLLGIIALGIILYGGFLWMTAGGDAEQVDRAKRTLLNGVIGLAIILASFAISQFVLNALVEATTEGGTGGPPGGGGGPGGIGPGGVRTFQVESITPQGDIPIRNTTVRILFNTNVDEATVGENIEVERASDGIAVDGTLTISGSRVSFVPSAACPTPNEDRKCFDENTEYRVTISEGLRSEGGLFVSCSGFGSICEGIFTTGDLVDVAEPDVEVTYPDSGQGVPVNSIITLQAQADDDAGVGLVDFEIDGALVGSDGPGAPTPLSFTAHHDWDTTGYTLGTRVDIAARAYDIDDNNSLSSSVTVTVRAEHCFNGIQDEGETGVDCGGDPASVDYCGGCSGGSCASDDDCSSGYCEGGVCVSLPLVESVSPLDGAPGTMITVSGQYFGTISGEVRFLGAEAEGDEIVAPFAPCGRTWTNNQIIIVVPDGAVTGPVEVVTNAGDSDATDDTRGPIIPDFLINTVERPGICEVNPDEGESGTSVIISGSGFGDTEDTVTIGTAPAGRIDSWSDASVGATIPPLATGSYPVKITRGGIESNEVSFQVVERGLSGVPVIAQIDPEAGPIGQYVTIYGDNFGSGVGTVTFTNPSTGQSAVGDIDFPEECGDDFWHRDNITVKVPDEYSDTNSVTLGAHEVTVARTDGRTSVSASFTVNDEALTPGICRISPNVGPVGTEVMIYGERLGGAPGTVNFYNGVSAAVGDWSAEAIGATVPGGAVTGPVTITSSAGGVSNSINYRVESCLEDSGACDSDQQCCSDGTCILLTEECEMVAEEASFVWRFSTGIIPITPQVIEECTRDNLPASPAPWDVRSGGDQVCINAIPVVRFNVPMDIGRFTPSNIEFKKCVGTGGDPCESTVDVLVNAINAIGDNHGFEIIPQSNFDTEAHYLIKLSTNLRGDGTVGSLEMEENADECGEGYAYCYEWQTRATDDLCTVGGVAVIPGYKIAKDTTPVPYSASAFDSDDICISLNPASYDWLWESNDIIKAQITVPNPAEGWLSEAEPITETEGDSVQISAEITGQGVSDFGELVIDFTNPAVVRYEPECIEACTNATIYAEFNTLMNESTLNNPSNVQIFECSNENCNSFVGGNLVTGVTALDPTTWQQILLHHTPFAPRTYYRVILSDQIQSYTNSNLVGLNWGENFSWIFRTRDSDVPCEISDVLIEPPFGYTEARGDRVVYTALPLGSPDECSTVGQFLDPATYDWAWSVVDTAVGELMFGGTIDTSLESISRGCDVASCLHLGSESFIAVCGNGVIETVLGEECDDGNLLSGDGCTSNCLRERILQVGAGGTCGNADVEDLAYISPWDNPWIEAGEECDDGNDIYGDGCDEGCQNEGSTLSGSICGNGDLGNGEDCDDGNRRSGDGCSPECLNEGSMPGPRAVCGNSIIENELGEDCDNGMHCADGRACLSNLDCAGVGDEQCRPRPGDGCSDICLNEGTYPCVGSGDPDCCGNAVIDIGESCDGGEGCGRNCLHLGASYDYSTPSFCGDGATGAGEDTGCEIGTSGDGRVDNTQIVEAVGLGTVDEEGNQTTDVRAAADGVEGTANFTMLCGFIDDSECKAIDSGLGLATNSCCYPMPHVTNVLPVNTSNDICRNALIQVEFSEALERASLEYDDGGTMQNRIFVIKGQTASCGSGEETYPIITLTDSGESVSWWRFAFTKIKNFFKKIVGRLAFARADETIDPRRDLNYCSSGIVEGDLSLTEDGSVVSYSLNNVLDPDTWYQIRVLPGIQNDAGVEMQSYYASVFGTGTEVCELDYIVITDPEGNYYFDTKEPATPIDPLGARSFIALAATRRAGLPPEAIQEMPGQYEWEWSWSSSIEDGAENDIITVSTSDDPDQLVTPAGLNGDEQVSAQARITLNKFFGAACEIDSDCPRNLCVGATDIAPGNCAGETVSHSVTSVVNLCENPWPDPDLEPILGFCYFTIEGGPSIKKGPCNDDSDCRSAEHCVYETEGVPYFADPDSFHFATTYCRDQEIGLLPELDVQIAEPISGVLKDYLLIYSDAPPEAAYARDGIGLRVMPNPFHLSPEEWYREQGFGGTPEITEVDGYPAIKVGTSVYINGANKFGDPALYTNIYILSYNEDASETTVNIFNQLLNNFILNYDNVSNERLCRNSAGDYLEDEGGQIVRCSADVECIRVEETAYCDSGKDKLRRDVERITNMIGVEKSLDTYRTFTGGRRTCFLGSADLDYDCVENSDCDFLDEDAVCLTVGGTVPTLEAGSFIRALSTSKWPSWQNELGSALGMTVAVDPVNEFAPCEGYDPDTCFNSDEVEFFCPAGSKIYQYHSIGGEDYVLHSDLEYPNYWAPETLPGHVRWNEGCNNTTYSNDNLCGDGLIGPAEECELGDTTLIREGCSGAARRSVSCVQDGSVCRWADSGEEGYGACVDAFPICGNGVREGFCAAGEMSGLLCQRDIDCPGGTCALVESCDDGANNGLYGHCNIDCSGSGAYCGDGVLAGAEECDLGDTAHRRCRSGLFGRFCDPINGDYASGCSWDCRVPGPMCGDGILQSEEACEHDQTDETTSGVCEFYPDVLCASDEDCPGAAGGYRCSRSGAKCTAAGVPCTSEISILGPDICEYVPPTNTCLAACVPDSAGYETKRVRTCTTSCEWGDWTPDCVTDNVCGNGILEGAEECDDGNTDNTDGCIIVPGRETDMSISCRIASCGDGYRYLGVESCDAGSANGISCESRYGETCTYCTDHCNWATATGPYCGDGTIQEEYEECDEGPIACWYTSSFTGDIGYIGEIAACDPYDEMACPDRVVVHPGTTFTPPMEETIIGECQGLGISLNHEPVIPGPEPPDDYGYNARYCDTSCRISRVDSPRCGDGVSQARPYPPLPWTSEGVAFWATSGPWTTQMPAGLIRCTNDNQCPGDEICDDFDGHGDYCYRCDNPEARSGCVLVLEAEGEVCDSGENNVYPYNDTLNQYCNTGCTAFAPFCGDGAWDSSYGEQCDWGSRDFEDRIDVVVVSTYTEYFGVDGCGVVTALDFCESFRSEFGGFTEYDIDSSFYLVNGKTKRMSSTQVTDINGCIDGIIAGGQVRNSSGGAAGVDYTPMTGHPEICGRSWASGLGGCESGTNLFSKNYESTGSEPYWAQAVADVLASHDWRPGALKWIIVLDNNTAIGTGGGNPGDWDSIDTTAINSLVSYFNEFSPEERPIISFLVDTHRDFDFCLYDADTFDPLRNWSRFTSAITGFASPYGSAGNYVQYFGTSGSWVRDAVNDLMNSLCREDCTCLFGACL